jgi:hypothetical protein
MENKVFKQMWYISTVEKILNKKPMEKDRKGEKKNGNKKKEKNICSNVQLPRTI